MAQITNLAAISSAFTGPYTMRTTKVVEHERGIYWKADLLCAGQLIGSIEQMGNGGADRVRISDSTNKAEWDHYCKSNGGEEHVTYALLIVEEATMMQKEVMP